MAVNKDTILQTLRLAIPIISSKVNLDEIEDQKKIEAIYKTILAFAAVPYIAAIIADDPRFKGKGLDLVKLIIKFFDPSSIQEAIAYYERVDTDQTYTAKEPEVKEETTSIPPELEALVAEYQANLAEKHTNDGTAPSVAESVKRAQKAMLLRQRLATIRHNRAALSDKSEAEFNATEDKNFEKILKDTVRPKNVFPADQHVLEPVRTVVDQVVTSYINNLPDLTPEQEQHLHDLSSEIKETVEYLALREAVDIANYNDLTVAVSLAVYEADHQYSSPISDIYTQLEENNKEYDKLNRKIAEDQISLSDLKHRLTQDIPEEEREHLNLLVVSIESHINKTTKIRDSLTLDTEPFAQSVETFLAETTTKTFSGIKNPDLDTQIDTARSTLNTVHDKLTANKDIKPNIPPPEDKLKEASNLENGIRTEMPQLGLNLHPTSQGVQAAALLSNPEAHSPDLSSHALLLYSQGLGTKELDLVIAHTNDHQNDPNSQLGRLLKANPHLFGTLRQQLSNIEASHIEKVNNFIKDPTNKDSALAKFAKNDPAAYKEYLELSKTNTPKQIVQFAKNNPGTKLGEFFANNKKIFGQATSELIKIKDSALAKEIKGSSNPVTRTVNNVNNRIFSGLTKIPFLSRHQGIIKTILDPIGSFRHYLGQRFARFFVKNVLRNITNATLRQTAKILYGQGLKTTLKFLSTKAIAKLAAWAATKLGISVALNSLNIAFPFVGTILNVAFLALAWVGEKTFGVVKNAINSISQTFSGQDFNLKRSIGEGAVALGALAGAGASGIGSFFTALGTASAAATGSALGIIIVASFIGYFFYITSILVAPMISTIAQLEAMPSQPAATGDCIFPVHVHSPICNGPLATTHALNQLQAVDFCQTTAAEIHAIAPGTVTFAGNNGMSYGNFVIISTTASIGTFDALYAHMSEIGIGMGEQVSQDEVIGITGGTGWGSLNYWDDHLHLGYRDIIYNQCPAGGIPIPEGCGDFLSCGSVYSD